MHEVVDVQLTPVPGPAVPKVTADPPMTKSVPVNITTVPPLTGPVPGLSDSMFGVVSYMNRSATDGAEVPPAVDTVTSTVPEPGGEVAEHEMSEVQLTDSAPAPPKAAVMPPGTNPVPVRITNVPPLRGPFWGSTAVTVGTDT